MAAAQENAQQNSGNPQSIQYLLLLLGPAGVLGSIVALLRFKTDNSQQVFTQYQSVTDEWRAAAESRKLEIAEKAARINELEAEIEKMRLDHARQIRQLEAKLVDLRDQIERMRSNP